MAMPGPAAATSLVAMLDGGVLVHAHRAVVVNLIARMRPDALAPIAAALDSVDPYSPGHGLASVVADLATTRHRMLDELSRG